MYDSIHEAPLFQNSTSYKAAVSHDPVKGRPTDSIFNGFVPYILAPFK